MSLSSPRNTIETDTVNRVFNVAANAKIWQGGLVMLVAGAAAPGAAAVGAVALGRAEESVDNTGGAAGAQTVRVKRGCFKFANSATDPVSAVNIGANCYIVDDATVSATDGNNTRSVAGLVHQLDADGVWVRF